MSLILMTILFYKVLIGSFSNDDGDGIKDVKKAISVY